MTNDIAVPDGNKVEPVDPGMAGPDRLDYVDLFSAVMSIAGEGSSNNRLDGWPL